MNKIGLLLAIMFSFLSAYPNVVAELSRTFNSADAGDGVVMLAGTYIDGEGVNHGFEKFYMNGKEFTGTFDIPGSKGTIPFSISGHAQVTGWSFFDNGTPAGIVRGFVRINAAVMIPFDAKEGVSTFPCCINTAGEITGYYSDPAGPAIHGFIRHPADGSIETIDVSGATNGTVPLCINAVGDVTGFYQVSTGSYHGFARAHTGSITPFDIAGAGTNQDQGTYPVNMNSLGDITGWFIDSSGVNHGFIRTNNDGKIITFDAANAGNANKQGTFPACVNAAGEVTGHYFDSNGNSHGFLRTSSGVITKFDTIGAGTKQAQGTFPAGIISTGVIGGNFIDGNGVYHGFCSKPSGDSFPVTDIPSRDGRRSRDNSYEYESVGESIR